MKRIVFLILSLLLLNCVAEKDKAIQISSEPISNNNSSKVQIVNNNEIKFNGMGIKLVKIIDIQLGDPNFKNIITFVGNEKIIINTDPYQINKPNNKLFFLYDISFDSFLNEFRFKNTLYAGFSFFDDDTIYFYHGKDDKNIKDYKYIISTNTVYDNPLDNPEMYYPPRKIENYNSLKGIMTYKWNNLSLNPWANLRGSVGLDLRAGDEFTIGMFDRNKELLFTFPFVRIADNGMFHQSQDGKYLALEAGFYRKDIFRNEPPPYMPEKERGFRGNFSGTKNDIYQYGVFIYEAITDENIDILENPTVEVITFPTPSQISKGTDKIKRHSFNGAHLHVKPGIKPFWGTAIEIKEGTKLYKEKSLNSDFVKTIGKNKSNEIIVKRDNITETISGITNYWYYLEDSTGERGWVFGDTQFNVVKEKPYFIK